ncbi:hypothetical protein [Blastococcus brunescens]|uniref:Uncharacterized protein n=1 Tax=Blastococcus brunescens TaxID=1564165 RepID=A0ABZ1B784_9ACTN|nr:hypothetical protein [Blastococcus sp. BMG 8361]WRL66242.1 hypothetical protein U6N30_12675 [Blastococcus sp. BMG 8361]
MRRPFAILVASLAVLTACADPAEDGAAGVPDPAETTGDPAAGVASRRRTTTSR